MASADAPSPPVALTGACSIIRDNTLYVYSPDAFQALPLHKNGTWSQLPGGTSVTGGVCVKGTDDHGEDALYIVGGSANSSNADYPGLQQYSFTKKTWNPISPVTTITKNRQNHAATFLDDSQSILVYSGSQDEPNTASIETFTISVTSPYNVQSFTSKNAPVVSPSLFAWSGTSAICLGGTLPSNQPNKDVFYFSANHGGWHTYTTTLKYGLPTDGSSQSVLVTGADGSKVLETFNFNTSPNTVTQTVLQRANGQPAASGTTIGGKTSGKKRKRDVSLTLTDWPRYNASSAPTAVRSGFALAQSDDGLVAVAGGNTEHPVALFNEQTNTWLSTRQFFGQAAIDSQQPLQPTSSVAVSSSTSSPTATNVPSSSPTAAPADGTNHPHTSLILGATLGSILGFIVLLIIFLLMLRYKRRKKQEAAAGKGDDEKQRLSFADRGASFMVEAGGAANKNGDPHSSMAIMSGKILTNYHQRNGGGSDVSTTRLVPKKSGLSEALEMETIREKSPLGWKSQTSSNEGNAKAQGSSLQLPRRTSGWSRYFSGSANGSPTPTTAQTPIAPRKSAVSTRSMQSFRSSLESTSNYAPSTYDFTSSSNSRIELPPLNLGQQFAGSGVSEVMTESSSGVLPRESRPRTLSSDISSLRPSAGSDTLFNHDHDQQNWTSLQQSDWPKPRQRDTTASSIYTHDRGDSIATTRLGTSNLSSIYAPTNNNNSLARASNVTLWPRSQAATVVPQTATISKIAEQTKLSMSSGQSAITAIPIPASTAMPITVKKSSSKGGKAGNNDLNWVNLQST